MSEPTKNLRKDAAEVSRKVSAMVERIRTCMMTNLSPEGHLQSRPMMLQELDEGGDLWFIASLPSQKTLAIELEENVNLTFTDPENKNFVSISGIAEVIQDATRAHELWTPMAQSWFPKGPQDPEMALLRVQVLSAEYWDSPVSSVVQIYDLAKSILTGKRYEKSDAHGQTETLRH